MAVKLKPLAQQTIVITGASSGIGLATAQRAAERGATVVMAARNEEALRKAVADIDAKGGRAVYIVADVGKREDVERLAQETVARFGGFDTWVNNAGVAIFGRLEDVPLEDKRQLFETDFWGVVHGCEAAIPHLRQRGGALINIGSVVSDRAVPLQGIYSAAKHAVKGYTDALRMELEKEKAPISVTLIKPTSVDTMYLDHAQNYMDAEPSFPPPVYAPEIVADAILHAAQHPMRDLFVGSAARVMSSGGYHTPRTMDKYMELAAFKQQRDTPLNGDRHPGNLYAPQEDGHTRGRYRGPVRKTSYYTRAKMAQPYATPVLLGLMVAGVSAAALWHRGGPEGPMRRVGRSLNF